MPLKLRNTQRYLRCAICLKDYHIPSQYLRFATLTDCYENWPTDSLAVAAQFQDRRLAEFCWDAPSWRRRSGYVRMADVSEGVSGDRRHERQYSTGHAISTNN